MRLTIEELILRLCERTPITHRPWCPAERKQTITIKALWRCLRLSPKEKTSEIRGRVTRTLVDLRFGRVSVGWSRRLSRGGIWEPTPYRRSGQRGDE